MHPLLFSLKHARCFSCGLHAAAPASETNPDGQGVQAAAPTPENVLFVQEWQYSPVLENVPALQ